MFERTVYLKKEQMVVIPFQGTNVIPVVLSFSYRLSGSKTVYGRWKFKIYIYYIYISIHLDNF